MSSKHILLVEDDALLRHAFKLLLEDQGYIISEAGTAAEAITQATSNVPDLILLDLGLPDAPGLSVCHELRKHDATLNTQIIALTGRVGADQKQECLDAGCTSFMAKPVEPKVLMKKLKELLPS